MCASFTLKDYYQLLLFAKCAQTFVWIMQLARAEHLASKIILSSHTDEANPHTLKKKRTHFPLQNNHATEEELGIP